MAERGKVERASVWDLRGDMSGEWGLEGGGLKGGGRRGKRDEGEGEGEGERKVEDEDEQDGECGGGD